MAPNPKTYSQKEVDQMLKATEERIMQQMRDLMQKQELDRVAQISLPETPDASPKIQTSAPVSSTIHIGSIPTSLPSIHTTVSTMPATTTPTAPSQLPPLSANPIPPQRGYYDSFTQLYYPDHANPNFHYFLPRASYESYLQYNPTEGNTAAAIRNPPPPSTNFGSGMNFATCPILSSHPMVSGNFSPPIVTTYPIPPVPVDPLQSLQSEMADIKKLLVAQQKPPTYVAPPFRRQCDDPVILNSDDEREGNKKDGSFTTADIHQLYKDFQAASLSDQKLSLPEFTGETNGDAFIDWMLQIDAIFSYKHYGDPKRVQLVETKLRKGAMHWWRSVQTERMRAGLHRITAWLEMKAALQARYVPPSYRQDLAERIASLMQDKKSVEEYSDEFHTLSARAEINEPDFLTVGRYKRGLNKAIRDILRLSRIETMADAYQAALQAEELLATNSAPPLKSFTATSEKPSITTTFPKPKASTPGLFEGKCFVCNKVGHRIADCPEKKSTLLVDTTTGDDDVADKVTGCALHELMDYPEVILNPDFDYGPDCYELPLPRGEDQSKE